MLGKKRNMDYKNHFAYLDGWGLSDEKNITPSLKPILPTLITFWNNFPHAVLEFGSLPSDCRKDR